MNNLNIEPEGNDGQNRQGFGAILKSALTAILNSISWNDHIDLAVRFSVPLITMGVAATLEQKIQKEQELLDTQRVELNARRIELEQAERNASASVDFPGLTSSALNLILKEAEHNETQFADKALREVEDLQTLIKRVLSIRCSPTTSRDTRLPIEKEIRSRIVQSTGALAQFDPLRERMINDIEEIFQKDTRHCDLPWPLGTGDNGELYKVYRETWRLQIENQKLRKIMNHLKENMQQ